MRKDTGKNPERLPMTDVAGAVGVRVSYFIRQAHPQDTAKVVARIFGCSPKTVEGWLSGSLPMNRHLIQMMSRWGQRFIVFVFEPAVGTSLQAYQLDQELKEVKAQIVRLEGALNAANQTEVRSMADAGMDASRQTRR